MNFTVPNRKSARIFRQENSGNEPGFGLQAFSMKAENDSQLCEC